MFKDIIEMLLNKRAEVEAVLQKIDSMLVECGYVPQPFIAEQASPEKSFIDNGIEPIAESVVEPVAEEVEKIY